MITCISETEIERFIEEDVPYGDLTTHLLGIGATLTSCMQLPTGIEFLVAEGSAHALPVGWKVALYLLEYASGIASRTGRIVETFLGSVAELKFKARETKIIIEANAAEYAATGIDIIVLSSVYFGTPADIDASIRPF